MSVFPVGEWSARTKQMPLSGSFQEVVGKVPGVPATEMSLGPCWPLVGWARRTGPQVTGRRAWSSALVITPESFRDCFQQELVLTPGVAIARHEKDVLIQASAQARRLTHTYSQVRELDECREASPLRSKHCWGMRGSARGLSWGHQPSGLLPVLVVPELDALERAFPDHEDPTRRSTWTGV